MDTVSTSSLQQFQQIELDSLLEVTTAINENYPADQLFRIYGFILRAQIKAEKLIVFYKETKWKTATSFGLESEYDTQEYVEQFLTFKDPVLIQEQNFTLKENFEQLIPVIHKDEALAFILIAFNESDKVPFWDQRMRFLKTITNIVVVAVENKRLFKRQLEQERMKKELEVAKRVQSSLIPDQLPDSDRIQAQGVYLPHRTIGGDYYDYVVINKKESLICMADVSGKGIGASLLMANFQAMLRAFSKKNIELEKLLISLNEGVMERTKSDGFITMFIGKYNFESRELSYVSAGHPSTILTCTSEQGYELLDEGTTVIGAFEELPFLNIGKTKVEENAILYTYTDGLTDIENNEGEYFETELIADFIVANKDLEMLQLNNKMIHHIDKFSGEKDYPDDISFLACRFK